MYKAVLNGQNFLHVVYRVPRCGYITADVSSNEEIVIRVLDERNWQTTKEKFWRYDKDHLKSLERCGFKVAFPEMLHMSMGKRSTFAIFSRKYGTPIHIFVEPSPLIYNSGYRRNPEWYAVAHQAFGNRQLGKLQPVYLRL